MMSFCLVFLCRISNKTSSSFYSFNLIGNTVQKYYGADQLYSPATLLIEKVPATKVLPLCDRGSYYLVP